mmetsp:Transcript_18437/g.52883  ORF Transcript_18437/g.52883 Transcript_18437/m.52883 type:complete len:239 (+) Transcript_18437:80-796(+)
MLHIVIKFSSLAFLLIGGVGAFHFDGGLNIPRARLAAGADIDTSTARHVLCGEGRNRHLTDDKPVGGGSSRRELLFMCGEVVSGAALLSLGVPFPAQAAAADFAAMRDKVTEARRQLDPVPNLIKDEKWDSIRAILITPPLSDCWGKSSGANALLRSYAEAVGDQGGDELAALEAREEALDHLRFLDMASYNNVFNPIKTEGESGASKALIKSYYEDPINELKASTSALDELVRLGEV